MNYTQLIQKKKQYKYSVNICFDLRDEERLADFIPNVTTTETQMYIQEFCMDHMVQENHIY